MEFPKKIAVMGAVWVPFSDQNRSTNQLQEMLKFNCFFDSISNRFWSRFGMQNGTQKWRKNKAVIFVDPLKHLKWHSCSAVEKPANRQIHPSILKKSMLFVRAWWHRCAPLPHEINTLFCTWRMYHVFDPLLSAPDPLQNRSWSILDRFLIIFRSIFHRFWFLFVTPHAHRSVPCQQRILPCFTSKVCTKVIR